MTNEEILSKLRQDVRLRGLSPATEVEYLMGESDIRKMKLIKVICQLLV